MDSINKEQSYKLFLAMDIAGSTELKNRINLKSDWGRVIANIFKDFHSQFVKNLRRLHYHSNDANYNEVLLWKTLGDEMVFVCSIKDRVQIHTLITAFSLSLVYLDKAYYREFDLRLKGNVWGAEFLMRNRILNISKSIEDTTKNEVESIEDYIGLDMDIGFRLGKESLPSLLTVSMDIISLLSEIDEADVQDHIECCLVEHVKLKGVWNNLEYPIFWSIANEKCRKEFIEEDYKLPYKKFDLQFKQPKYYIERIEDIRSQLPKSLKIQKFFLPTDEEIPSEYKNKLNEHGEDIPNNIEDTENTFVDSQDDELATIEFLKKIKFIE